ncbi:MAG: hypothetical protein ACKOFW_08305, partial [Planctomycetaceae bacterium]
PILRWGKPYESLEKHEIVHFETGETLAKLHQATGGMVQMDKRHAQRDRTAGNGGAGPGRDAPAVSTRQPWWSWRTRGRDVSR